MSLVTQCQNWLPCLAPQPAPDAQTVLIRTVVGIALSGIAMAAACYLFPAAFSFVLTTIPLASAITALILSILPGAIEFSRYSNEQAAQQLVDGLKNEHANISAETLKALAANPRAVQLLLGERDQLEPKIQFDILCSAHPTYWEPLIQAGCDINVQDPNTYNTLLIELARNSQLPNAQQTLAHLIDLGADSRITNKKEKSAADFTFNPTLKKLLTLPLDVLRHARECGQSIRLDWKDKLFLPSNRDRASAHSPSALPLWFETAINIGFSNLIMNFISPFHAAVMGWKVTALFIAIIFVLRSALRSFETAAHRTLALKEYLTRSAPSPEAIAAIARSSEACSFLSTNFQAAPLRRLLYKDASGAPGLMLMTHPEISWHHFCTLLNMAPPSTQIDQFEVAWFALTHPEEGFWNFVKKKQNFTYILEEYLFTQHAINRLEKEYPSLDETYRDQLIQRLFERGFKTLHTETDWVTLKQNFLSLLEMTSPQILFERFFQLSQSPQQLLNKINSVFLFTLNHTDERFFDYYTNSLDPKFFHLPNQILMERVQQPDCPLYVIQRLVKIPKPEIQDSLQDAIQWVQQHRPEDRDLLKVLQGNPNQTA